MNKIEETQNGKIKVLFHVGSIIEIDRDNCKVLNMEEDYKIFVQKINQFKDHPLMIGWYINDETPECFNENLRNRTLTIHELDPDHPTISVENNRKRSPSFINTTDVYGVDCYPIGDGNNTENVNYYHRHSRAYNDLLKTKPMWSVPQIFDWTAIKKLGFKARAPTL